jgi:phospholipid-transporting ATPase
MQMIPVISISGGKPAMLLPLSFVIIVSMIKDIFEDFKRHNSDKKENYKGTLKWDPIAKCFRKELWRNLTVGSIIQVNCDEFLPADIVLLRSSEPKGLCYIETKNLDGETNLKHKNTHKQFTHIMDGDEFLLNNLKGSLLCEEPND